MFSGIPESQMRWWRWLLLLGWLALIASLLLPALSLPASLTPACPPAIADSCGLHRQPGNRLFWGVVVPSGVLVIGVISHELWRRICPLAFVSQLGRALGWQRTRAGKGGRLEVVKVDSNSWLGKHHIALQWSLLIAGLCLRLLWVNSSPTGLALLLVVTLLAAVLVGWAYGGKAWCQYVCPMGPVQTVLTGLRGPLGSTAHWGSNARTTQSMCRTVSADGREQSACVACQTPCLDIDAERAFWQTSRGKRGLSWAWLSYPGLVWAFFALMEDTVKGSDLLPNPLGYLRSGAWAFDAELPQRIWLPLDDAPGVPRLFSVPLMLSIAALVSVLLFLAVECGLLRLYQCQGYNQPADRALLHVRLLATFLAINLFFWFVDPLQGALGVQGGQLMRSLVLTFSSIALFRGWSRDQATYRRESVSDSLRRQLHDLPGLEAALDGRSLEALSPQEVFILVKALPALGRQQGRSVYQGVMEEMLRRGRLDRAAALLELADLRQTLGLDDSDHHTVVGLLAEQQPQLLDRDRLQRQGDELRQEAACEAIEELLRLSGLAVLEPSVLPEALRGRLDRLRAEIGLDEAQWSAVLDRFGPQGEAEHQRLQEQRAHWIAEEGLRTLLAQKASSDPLLRPLAQAMALRMRALADALSGRLRAAALEPLPLAVDPAGDLDQALDLLWRDPDPDTAGWVLMLARARDPQRVARYLQDPRIGLPDSPFLRDQREGVIAPDCEELASLAAADLFADLTPEGILWLARQGHLQALAPLSMAMDKGDAGDWLAVVIEGDVRLQTATGQQVVLSVGSTVGEMAVLTGAPRTTRVDAGPTGARLFVLPREAFEELLRRSRLFGRDLLAQLAQRLMASSAVLAK